MILKRLFYASAVFLAVASIELALPVSGKAAENEPQNNVPANNVPGENVHGKNVPGNDDTLKTTYLTPIVVTATRVERDLREIPLSVSVVGQQEIQRNPQTTIGDQLANVPGVQLGGANVAGDRRVLIRGQSAGATLILIDGVRQPELRNTAGAGLTISTNEIERIEVIKGPASVLYGSDALGGVINIITKKGGDKPVAFRLGSVYDSSTESIEPSASLFGAYEGFNYRFSGSGLDANDRTLPGGAKMYNSSYTQRDYRGQLGYDWDKGSISFSMADFQGSNNYTPVTETGDGGFEPAPTDKRATISTVPQNDRKSYSTTLVLNELTENFAKLRATAYWQQLDKKFQYYNYKTGIYSGKHNYQQQAYGGSLQSDWNFFDVHAVSLGVDYDNITLEKKDFYPSSGSGAQSDGDQQMLAVFLQDEWTIVPDVAFTAGLRQTWIKTALTKDTAAPQKEDSANDSNVVGSLGLVYSGIDNIALRALFSQGYKAPNLTQLFVGSSVIVPNPGLKPEESNNYELGARYTDDNLNVDLALFYSTFKNGIVYELIDPSSSRKTYNTKNIAKVNSYGAELAVDYTIPTTNFTPYANLNLLNYKTEDENGFKTDNTSRAPVWGTVGLKWETKAFKDNTFFVDGNMVMSEGAYTEKADGTKIDKTDSWHTANFTVGIEGGEENKYNVALSVRNIFDKYYQIASPFSPSSPLPEPGFHVVLSAGYEF